MDSTNENTYNNAFVNEAIHLDYYILSEEDKSILDTINNIILMKYLHNNKSTDFDPDLWECMKYIHMSPNKQEICKNWIYGLEFMAIDERHCNGNSFYDLSRGWSWEQSFCTDFLLQIYLIAVPHRDINDKLLILLHTINLTLRITMGSSMGGSPIYWESNLGECFQEILDLDLQERTIFLDLWKYKKEFNGAISDNANGKEYFKDEPEAPFMLSFVTSFIMNLYH